MLDFSQAELGALYDLFTHFHSDRSDEEIEDRVAYMTKGCKFHWEQQVERTAKALTRCAYEVNKIKARFHGLAEEEDPDVIKRAMDEHLMDYPEAVHWVVWWMRPEVRRMAFRAFSTTSSWDFMPSTNNLAETAHSVLARLCTSKSYPLVIANLWEHDFGEFLKLAAGTQGALSRWSGLGAAARVRNNRRVNIRRAEERSGPAKGRPMDLASEYTAVRRQLHAAGVVSTTVAETSAAASVIPATTETAAEAAREGISYDQQELLAMDEDYSTDEDCK